MKYEELVILLPCHSLEDFPTHHDGRQAESLLACWTALWHPALISSAQSTPAWYRIDDPPEELSNRLIVVPEVSEAEIPTGLASRAESEGACLLRDMHNRNEIVSTALQEFSGERGEIEKSVVDDFLALGFCYLQVELLTRQMRYSSNLDEIYFKKQTVAAADAAIAGNVEETTRLLTSCFDVLSEERDHFYPVDSYLVDLTLVASTTLGRSLQEELKSSVPSNFLLSGELLDELTSKNPDFLSDLKSALEAGKASVIGGERIEDCLALSSREAILENLRTGSKQYSQHLNYRPVVFGRRRFGLSPVLPQILQKLGYKAAFHATLDDGKFPEGEQSKIHWEGDDGTTIDALARVPLDATNPGSFLNFSMKLGESMDSDHVSTMVFAHWPGHACDWYDDLRRISKYGAPLGKFISLDEYFRDTDDGGYHNSFHPDFYRSPYLRQAVDSGQKDPISRWAKFYRRQSSLETLQAISTLTSLLTNKKQENTTELLSFQSGIDRYENNENQDAEQKLENELSQVKNCFAAAVSKETQTDSPGYLVINPSSYDRRVPLEVSKLKSLPAKKKPIFAAAKTPERSQAIVDVPAFGFAWVAEGNSSQNEKQTDQKLVEDFVLRNEYFEARINETTGSLQSIHDYKNRGNRLSQQLALRMPRRRQSSNPQERYSVMAADRVKVTSASSLLGEIESQGKIVDREGKPLAGFRQKYQLWRGSRVLLIDIELDIQQELSKDPWDSYYACRFAWADEAADLWRSVGMTRRKTDTKRLEAPHFVEIEMPQFNTAILTGGLPYHRRIGMRNLDSILVTRGETAGRFRLGVGIDVKYPLQEALGLLSPPVVYPSDASPDQGSHSGWLIHLDSKNVVCTHLEPITDQGKINGLRMRLLETHGRTGRVGLQLFRRVTSARQVNFQGEVTKECQIEGEKVIIEITQREWIELELNW